MTDQTVTITGAAGAVARAVRPLLRRDGRTLRLVDLAPSEPVAGETEVVGDLRDPEVARAAVAGADLVVHLGGVSSEDAWERVVDGNLHTLKTLLDAVVEAGGPTVLIASSLHADGYATPGHRPLPVAGTRPDSLYGWSKAAMEQLAGLYSDRHGVNAISARLGTVDPVVDAPRTLSTWLSPVDAARLIEAAACWEGAGHRVVWGFSANTRGVVDLGPGAAIGFLPLDDAELAAPTHVLAAADDWIPGILGGPAIRPSDPLGTPWG